jgi:hypothetical protein
MATAFEYDVAISFAGEQRDYARRIAASIKEHGCTVFFDEYEQATLWGTNLHDHLANVYEHKARYCLMLVSKEYAAKVWTSHERRSAQARALKQKEEYILPVRFDNTEVPGLPHTIGYIDADRVSPAQVCALVLAKLQREPKGDLVPEPLWRRFTRNMRRTRFLILGVGVILGFAIVLAALFFARLPRSPLTVSFDVWHDLGRDPSDRNKVYLQNKELAVVLYGSSGFDVREVDIDSVHLSDGTGSGVRSIRYYLSKGYDENNDGRDDLKLDFNLADLRSSANLVRSSTTLRLTGYLKSGNQPFHGEQEVTFVP